MAEDPQEDTLTYELDVDAYSEPGAPNPNADEDNSEPGDAEQMEHDVHYFSVDKDTGQIRVAKRLDYDGVDHGPTYNSTSGPLTPAVKWTTRK